MERTLEFIDDILEKMKDTELPLTSDEKYGVVGPSPLRELPGFDLTKDVTIEHMHLFGRGVIQRFINLTVKDCGDVKRRSIKRKQVPKQPISDALTNTQSLSEFRSTRELYWNHYKGNSFASFMHAYNIILF